MCRFTRERGGGEGIILLGGNLNKDIGIAENGVGGGTDACDTEAGETCGKYADGLRSGTGEGFGTVVSPAAGAAGLNDDTGVGPGSSCVRSGVGATTGPFSGTEFIRVTFEYSAIDGGAPTELWSNIMEMVDWREFCSVRDGSSGGNPMILRDRRRSSADELMFMFYNGLVHTRRRFRKCRL